MASENLVCASYKCSPWQIIFFFFLYKCEDTRADWSWYNSNLIDADQLFRVCYSWIGKGDISDQTNLLTEQLATVFPNVCLRIKTNRSSLIGLELGVLQCVAEDQNLILSYLFFFSCIFCLWVCFSIKSDFSHCVWKWKFSYSRHGSPSIWVGIPTKPIFIKKK